MNDGCYITGNNFTQTYFHELIVEDKPTPFQASETGIFQEVFHFPFVWRWLLIGWRHRCFSAADLQSDESFLNFWWDSVPRPKLYRVCKQGDHVSRTWTCQHTISLAHTHVHGHIRTHTLKHAPSTLSACGAVSFSVNVCLWFYLIPETVHTQTLWPLTLYQAINSAATS